MSGSVSPRPDERSRFRKPGLCWKVDGLSFRYPGALRPAVDGVSVAIRAGACTAVLGPNGSGKSTLLRLLLGTATPGRGTIHLEGRPLRSWSRRELARTVGVVPQHEQITFPITVRELVAMGRYPHLGLLRPARIEDHTAVETAADLCEIRSLMDRRFETLSGGERQRVRLARAIAQEPRVLVLDEPTLALDLRHEMQIFELVRRLANDGVTIVLVTHDLNLAARYAHNLVLLRDGRLMAAGAPGDVLTRELLERVYQWPLKLTEHPGPGPDSGAVQVTPLAGPPARDSTFST